MPEFLAATIPSVGFAVAALALTLKPASSAPANSESRIDRLNMGTPL
jgi:hypothetical protein